MLRRLSPPRGALAAVLGALLLAGCMKPALLEDTPSGDYTIERSLPDSLAQPTTRFVVVGDVQSGWRAEHKFFRRENWATWKQALFPFYQTYLIGNGVVGAINYKRGVPDYGKDQRKGMRRALHAAFDREDPDFWMILGDMCLDDGRRPGHWEGFIDEYRGLLDERPFLPVLGNHEYSNDATYGGPNYHAVFDYERFYVQDTPDMALLVLNSNFLVDQHDLLTDEQQEALFSKWFVSDDPAAPSWLERELAARADRPFKVVAMHHPLLTYSFHNKDWYEAKYGPDLASKRDRLVALLQAHGVQVVMSGHEHVYERSVLRTPRPDGSVVALHQVISSGGGTPVRREAHEEEVQERQARYDAEGLDVELLMQESVYHYTAVEQTPGALRLATYAVDLDRPKQARLLDELLIPRPLPTPEPAIATTPAPGAEPAAAPAAEPAGIE